MLARHLVLAPTSPLSPIASESATPSHSTPPTSASPSQCRWSDVVPPNSALTFAVVWDPDDEMVAFSSAELLGEGGSDTAAVSPTDACSQILTIGYSTVPNSENTATLQYFRDNHEWLFVDNCTSDRLRLGRTQTSSTLGELDVYLRGSLMGKAHRNNRYFSCLEMLDPEFEFDPRTSFARRLKGDKGNEEEESVTDEGFYEVECLPMRGTVEREVSGVTPRVSLLQPSSSSNPDGLTSTWSKVEPTEIPDDTRYSIYDPPGHRHNRLKKRRPAEIPAPPSEVLRREVFDHQVSLPAEHLEPQPQEEPPLCSSISRLRRTLSYKKKRFPVERWICVEIAPK